MKKFALKNQVSITSLAILIAVAGYLNYSENNLKDITIKSKTEKSEPANEKVLKNTEVESENESAKETILPEDESSTDLEPGTAILTNTGTFSANARLQREQVRAKNKETLMNMLNSGNLSEEQKADISGEMVHITETAQLESEIETLIEAKGFTDVVVSIGKENVDVVLNLTEVSDSQRAKIEDIVKRKTGFDASAIVITPITVEN